jgi:hypothetical protein
MEVPFILLVGGVSARWLLRRLPVAATRANRLAMGCVALVLMVIAEFTLVLATRGLTVRQ